MKIVIIWQYTLLCELSNQMFSQRITASHICFVPTVIRIHMEPEVEEVPTVSKHSDSTQTCIGKSIRI